MPSHGDPFTGLPLSGQAPPSALDQRLFEPLPPKRRPSSPTPLPKPGKTATGSAPNRNETGPMVSPAAERRSEPKVKFDLREVPLYKASFLFTQEELEALEDLKIELRRAYDNKVTKNDLIRVALHMLLEEHAAGQAPSCAVRRIAAAK